MADRKYKVGSDVYDIPEAQSADFLKDFPDAVELEGFVVGKDTFDIPITEREAFLADFPSAKSLKKKVSSEPSVESAETSSREQSQYQLEVPEFNLNSMGSDLTPSTPESVSLQELTRQPNPKEFSIPDTELTLPEGGFKEVTPETLGEDYLQGKDIPRAEPPRLTTPVGDMLRSLKAGSLQALGSLSATPKMINDTLFDLTAKPILRLMGATEEEMQYVNNAAISAVSGGSVLLTAESQAPLNKKAEETRAKMAAIDGNIWSNLTKGADGEKDLGTALELFGRGAMETAPFMVEVAATSGGSLWGTLAVIAATTATQQYAENEGMSKNRRLNAWMYGGFEGLGELATGVIFRGIGKAFRSGLAKNLSPAHAKSIAKGIASAVGLESSSEAVTQIGQNFTDIVTGKNPQLSIFDNVPDAAILGGGLGLLGGGLRPMAAIVGRALASDKDVKSVQENIRQQAVLIEQIDKTDSESVKEALKNSIGDLRTQADDLMNRNYVLAQKLTEEERNQVAKLYAVADELQAEIDNGNISDERKPAIENTIKGLKDQIQTIKDNKIVEIEEEANKKTKGEEGEKKEAVTFDDIVQEEIKKEDKEADKQVEPQEEVTKPTETITEQPAKSTDDIKPTPKLQFVQEPTVTTGREQEGEIEQKTIEYESIRGAIEPVNRTESDALLGKVQSASGYFADRVKEIVNKYLVFPIRKLADSWSDGNGFEYAFLPRPTENTGIRMDYRDYDTEKKWGEPMLYDKTIINSDGKIIDDRYVPYDKDFETSRDDDPNHLYRGMSGEEFTDALNKGGFESNKNMNLGGQEETTSFAQHEQQAFSYAFGFTGWHDNPTFDNPRYVVRVKREGVDYKINDVKEADVSGTVPLSNIVDVWELRLTEAAAGRFDLRDGRDGKFKEGSRIAPHTRVAVRKLSPKEVDGVRNGIKPEITTPPPADIPPIQAGITPESTQTTTQSIPPTIEPISETRPITKDVESKIKEVRDRLANNLEDLMGAIGGIQKISGDQRASVIQILQKIIKDLAELTGLKGQQLYNRLKDELSKKGAKIADDVIDEAFKGSEYNIEPPVKETIGGVQESKDQKYRKTQTNSLIQDATLQQQEVAKIVDANKEMYEVLHQADAVEQAKKLIDDLGVQGATIELKKKTKDMADYPVRNVARLVLLDFYSRAIVDRNASESDKNVAFEHIDELQQITARENTKAGQGIAMMKIWKAMQPAGVLEYVTRKINKANDTILNKKRGDSTLGEQLDELYDTLDRESQKIIDDILSGKKVRLPQGEVKTKPAVPRKYVPRERIKLEQDYRRGLLDRYKAEKGSTLSASIAGLTKEQIELGGNLLASYVREGYYRAKDLVDKLTSDFKSVGIELTEDQKQALLDSSKNDKESFGEFSERTTKDADNKAADKFIENKVKQVIREHWNKNAKDELRRTLAQKLVDEAGLTEAEAKRIEKDVLAEFDKQIIERSQKQLTKVLGTQRIPSEKQKKGVVGKMIDLINLGALDEKLYRDLFADKFKLVELTDAHKEEILRLANNVQLASGKGWLERDATIRLAKYIYELYPQVRSTVIQETMMDMAYANMLMGVSTSVLNLTSAGSNIIIKPIRNVLNFSKWLNVLRRGPKGFDIYNPFGEMFYVPALYGINYGANEASEVYKNGDLNNKYIEEVAKKEQFRVRQVERSKYGKGKRFKPVKIKIGSKTVDLNIFNLYKYSGRNLAAQDKLMLTTSYEIEVAQILRDKLRSANLTGRDLTRKVMEIIRGEHIDMDKINATIEEDAALYKEMTGEDMSPIQRKIRRRELMMEELPLTKEEKDEAEMLARSNIFTDDRGGMFATVASLLGRLANWTPTSGMLVKPFVPFTKVVGNVSEYMMDHVPFYGFLRANGWSVSGLKKLLDADMPTAQMGARGSRAYYEQMGRAWLGTTAFITSMAMFLGTDEEDFLEISGGYNTEGFKKRGRENALPPYTLRIGSVKIGYKNLPGLAIPLSLVGNMNDALKLGRDESDIRDRLNASLILDAVSESVFMVKDMSFLDGLQKGTEILTNLASSDENKWGDVGEDVIKSYLGFLTRPLPQNNNAIQQIWKFFDPVSYSQSDIKGVLGYAMGIQHFVGRPSLDQFGEPIKSYPGETLMPYTHWFGVKGQDERWKFLAKYNAIPNKLYNRTMQIEGSAGIEKRKLEPDELFDYTERTGQLFSDYLNKYMSEEGKVSDRSTDKVEREKANGETEIVSGVRDDVEKLWAKAKDDAEMELFRWGAVKEDMPEAWNLIKKHQAYQLWQSSKSINGVVLNKSQLYEFNSQASLKYAERIQTYLKGSSVDADKKRINKDGVSRFHERIDDIWDDSKKYATSQMTKQIKREKPSK